MRRKTNFAELCEAQCASPAAVGLVCRPTPEGCVGGGLSGGCCRVRVKN